MQSSTFRYALILSDPLSSWCRTPNECGHRHPTGSGRAEGRRSRRPLIQHDDPRLVSGVLSLAVPYVWAETLALRRDRPCPSLWISLNRPLGHLAIGLPAIIFGTLGVCWLLETILVQSTDPLTLARIVLSLTVASFIVCLTPVRQAARLDPMVSLWVE